MKTCSKYKDLKEFWVKCLIKGIYKGGYNYPERDTQKKYNIWRKLGFLKRHFKWSGFQNWTHDRLLLLNIVK